jgi:hypothetical protein
VFFLEKKEIKIYLRWKNLCFKDKNLKEEINNNKKKKKKKKLKKKKKKIIFYTKCFPKSPNKPSTTAPKSEPIKW